MDTKILQKLSYGLFVLCANQNGKDNGCIINTVVQFASDPLNISFAINKTNYTCKMVQETKKCTISILNEDATFDLFKNFGFCSGFDTDKFREFANYKRVANGNVVITKGTNAYISLDIKQQVDLGSHILFLGEPTDGEIFNEIPSATYAYYLKNIKPKPQQKQEINKTIYRCTICGYEYVGEILPEDYICPICKHPASDFIRIN